MPVKLTIEHTDHAFRRDVLIERADPDAEPGDVNSVIEYRAILVGRGHIQTAEPVTFKHRYGAPVTKLAQEALQAMSNENVDPGPLTNKWAARRGAKSIEAQLHALGIDPNEPGSPAGETVAEVIARTVLVAVTA